MGAVVRDNFALLLKASCGYQNFSIADLFSRVVKFSVNASGAQDYLIIDWQDIE